MKIVNIATIIALLSLGTVTSVAAKQAKKINTTTIGLKALDEVSKAGHKKEFMSFLNKNGKLLDKLVKALNEIANLDENKTHEIGIIIEKHLYDNEIAVLEAFLKTKAGSIVIDIVCEHISSEHADGLLKSFKK